MKTGKPCGEQCRTGSTSSNELRTVVCEDGGVLQELYKAEGFGQITVRRFPPGEASSGARHLLKNELWWVVAGEASIRLELPDGTRELHNVTGPGGRIIEVPAGTGHQIANVGQADVVLLFHADRIYDPEEPDREDWSW